MIYLIGQLALWLLLTIGFAALAGWAFKAQRAAPAERAVRRERDNLLRDLIAMASGEAGAANDEADRARGDDAVQRMLDIRDGRIRELEQALEGARSRADDAASEVAELQRRLERGDADANELRQLRAFAAEQEMAHARTWDAETAEIEDAPEENGELQMWRLRYFEQRVRYLESSARTSQAHEPPQAAPKAALDALDWRAREAEARAEHLASELRAAASASAIESASEEEPPFAANADVDKLLRWRLLYLERRVAHLQKSAQPIAAPTVQAAAAPDPDRWKWRARYLEARVRHLEQRAPHAEATRTAQTVESDAEEAPPPASPRRGAKPPLLPAARNGAPDDFTLIDGVSLQQQSTLYSLGVFHFDQIAAWSPDHVAWVDNYLRLRGRIEEQEWIEQAADLARDGPAAARRSLFDENA